MLHAQGILEIELWRFGVALQCLLHHALVRQLQSRQRQQRPHAGRDLAMIEFVLGRQDVGDFRDDRLGVASSSSPRCTRWNNARQAWALAGSSPVR